MYLFEKYEVVQEKNENIFQTKSLYVKKCYINGITKISTI